VLITPGVEDDTRLGVLIISYHQEHFLADAVKSVRQGFGDQDEIVVAVLDPTRKTIETIRSLLSETTLSIRVATFNIPPFTTVRVLHEMLPLMKSDCIVLLAADDALTGEYKSVMLDSLSDSKRPVVLNSTLILTDEELKPVGYAYPRWSTREWLNRLWLLFENPGKAPGAVIPRQAVIDSDFMNLDSRCLIEDFPLWLFLSDRAQFRHVNHPVVRYRQHANSLSGKVRNADFCWSIGYCIGLVEAHATTFLERLLVRLGRRRWYRQTDPSMRESVEQGRRSAAVRFG